MQMMDRHLYNLKYNKEHREEIREKRRLNREKENAKRRLRMKEISKKNYEHSKKMGYVPAHTRTRRRIRKLGIRPKSCSICGFEGTIVAHHPDYNKRNEVVFCCNSCHKLIHSGEKNVEGKIIKICDAVGEKELSYCYYCKTPIVNNSGRKYCKDCEKIAHRDAQRRYKEKLLFAKTQ